MASFFFDLDCGEDEPVTLEKRLPEGEVIFHGFDVEGEQAAAELGFKTSFCFKLWKALEEDDFSRLISNLYRWRYSKDPTDPNQLEAVLFVGASPNSKPYHWRNTQILEHAVEQDSVEGVRILLEYGASVGANHGAAVRLAAARGNATILQMLVDEWPHVRSKKDEALRNAAHNGHAAVVEILLDTGARVHAENDEALRSAAKNGHADVVEILLEAGANVHANFDEPLRKAIERNHYDVVYVLQEWIEEHG
jgi:hypothetical protein